MSFPFQGKRSCKFHSFFLNSHFRFKWLKHLIWSSWHYLLLTGGVESLHCRVTCCGLEVDCCNYYSISTYTLTKESERSRVIIMYHGDVTSLKQFTVEIVELGIWEDGSMWCDVLLMLWYLISRAWKLFLHNFWILVSYSYSKSAQWCSAARMGQSKAKHGSGVPAKGTLGLKAYHKTFRV